MNTVLFIVILLMSIQTQPAKRKLLLFGKAQPEYKAQVELLKQDSIGMAERDLILITVDEEPGYKKYNVAPNQFTLLLIGKDDSEKLRSAKPIQLEKIFALIDSMPMRQEEMSRKRNP